MRRLRACRCTNLLQPWCGTFSPICELTKQCQTVGKRSDGNAEERPPHPTSTRSKQIVHNVFELPRLPVLNLAQLSWSNSRSRKFVVPRNDFLCSANPRRPVPLEPYIMTVAIKAIGRLAGPPANRNLQHQAIICSLRISVLDAFAAAVSAREQRSRKLALTGSVQSCQYAFRCIDCYSCMSRKDRTSQVLGTTTRYPATSA